MDNRFYSEDETIIAYVQESVGEWNVNTWGPGGMRGTVAFCDIEAARAFAEFIVNFSFTAEKEG